MEFDFSNIESWNRKVTLKDGVKILIRAERKADFEPLWRMYSTLSEDSLKTLSDRYSRNLVSGWVQNLDYDKSLPILAFDYQSQEKVVGMAILHFSSRDEIKHKAEYGIVIHDEYQGRGLGTILTKLMIEIAKIKGLKKIGLSVYTHNESGFHVYKKCGYDVEGLLKMEHWHYLLEKYVDCYRMGIIL